MLKCRSARQAVDMAMEELHSGDYGGANFTVADPESGWVIHGGRDPDVSELEQGLNVIGDRDFNDHRDERAQMAQRLLTLQTLDSPVKFLAIASKVLARQPTAPGRPSMVVREKDYGTVSSTPVSYTHLTLPTIYSV